MAVAEMQRLVLVGNNKERRALLKLLHRVGCVEIDKTHDIQDLSNIDMTERKEKVSLQLAKLALAFDIIKEKKMLAKTMLKRQNEANKKWDKAHKGEDVTPLKDRDVDDEGNVVFRYSAPKSEFLQPKPQITFEEFVELENNSKRLFHDIDDLTTLNNELVQLKSEEAKNNNTISSMSLYRDIDMPLSAFKDTRNVSVFLGIVPSSKREKLEEALNVIDYVAYEFQGEGNFVALLVTCLRDKADEVNECLMSFDFAPINTKEEAKPREIIERAELSNKNINNRRTRLIMDILEYEDELKQYQLLYDYYTLESDKANREEGMKTTGTSYVLEAWIPKAVAEDVDRTLTDSPLTLSFLLRDPVEGEIPPTLVYDNTLVTPYEGVTNMFAVPQYGEVNPNPIMGFFFFLFFGVMVSDAGYGLLLTLATGFALWRLKPGKHEAGLIKILFMGGISTMLWGVMFGSYFGITWNPILFSPLDEPVSMMILSIGLGLVQMLVGLGINAYSLFRQKKPFDAIFGVFSWYLIVLGIGLFAGKMLIENAPAALNTAGIAVLCTGLVFLMVSGALHAKGIKKVTGAFGSLYGIVNFFSDLLSYTRLFGLGLATGVIGMVFNKIAVVMIDLVPVLGVIIAIVLLVVGHVFNLGINTLGAYVHNSRLQFIEFFGKFYEGGGRLFAPLGANTKYYNVVVPSYDNVMTRVEDQYEAKKNKK